MLQIAMNVEAQAIDVPTGAQDYRPALYGGISAVELGVDGVRRVPLPVAASELERRLVLAYTGAIAQLRHQQLGGHQAAYRRRSRRAAPLRAHPRHRRRDARRARTRRLERGRPPDRRGMGEPQGPGAGRHDAGDRRACSRAARAAGAFGGKVCGAGGGGCLFCLGEPDRIPAIRDAIAANGGTAPRLHASKPTGCASRRGWQLGSGSGSGLRKSIEI